MLKGLLDSYRAASKVRPLSVAFATCYVKGAASDFVAQKVIERKEELSLKRNCAFSLFSAAYLGIGQHYMYNVAFAKIFGTSMELRVGIQKVIADATVHVPFIYLPLYYMFEDTALGVGTPASGLQRWRAELWDTMCAYWKIFPAFHLFNFTVTPVELRIGLIACVSFVWLIVLSYMSHWNVEKHEE
eukprot:TRINITY_DN80357_c0_g1_i1.p2 TRINITY_DN80357_c0_g1~~TRINITY_DN80357_c0_g1_i1.p2  ORF type:complete len:187 (-),score=41.23 TRINITY_DN80357_c0_g1_i1:47-607(-)